MWLVEKEFRVKLGSNTYINTPILVAYRGESLFTVKRHDDTGYLGIDFDVYSAARKKIASVRRNEIYFGDKAAYKIDGTENRYIFTERSSGRVICDIKRREDAHPDELEVSVHLYTPGGFLFEAGPEQTNIGSNTMRNCTLMNCAVGIAIN